MSKTFAEPSRRYFRQLSGTLFFLLVPMAGLVYALIRGSSGFVVAGLVLLGLALLPLTNAITDDWEIAVRVEITDESIQTRSLLGVTRQLRWNEIVERREFVVDTALYGGQPTKQVRLIGKAGTKIAISGELPAFDDLHEIIRAKTAHARETGDSRSWWRRQFGVG